MSLGLLGKKLGMTRLFDEKSQAMIPVTVIEVSGNTCLQVKTLEKDGYSAVQVGYDDKKPTAEIMTTVAEDVNAMERELIDGV